MSRRFRSDDPRPPALVRTLLTWLAGDDDALVSDLDEELATYQQAQRGFSAARRW